jgi:hypothetical protein
VEYGERGRMENKPDVSLVGTWESSRVDVLTAREKPQHHIDGLLLSPAFTLTFSPLFSAHSAITQNRHIPPHPSTILTTAVHSRPNVRVYAPVLSLILVGTSSLCLELRGKITATSVPYVSHVETPLRPRRG